MAPSGEGSFAYAMRIAYCVLAALVGVPALLTALCVAAMAVFVGALYVASGEWGWSGVAIAGVLGIAGAIGWSVLAWRYVRHGAAGLRASAGWTWCTMALGVAIATQVSIGLVGETGGEVVFLWWAPALLPLAAWLLPAAWPWRGAKT